MSSEKSRYLKRNRGPTCPLDEDDLMEHLPSLGPKRLAELLWVRAQNDKTLMKALMASVGIRLAGDNWDKAKSAIEYGLHFPDFARYTESGHGLILDEIKSTLQSLFEEGNTEFAARAARYAVERAQEVAENFENDWDWTSSLDDLSKWTDNVTQGKSE
jgi:hypothetical protein